jgi:hypothetical protein
MATSTPRKLTSETPELLYWAEAHGIGAADALVFFNKRLALLFLRLAEHHEHHDQDLVTLFPDLRPTSLREAAKRLDQGQDRL